MNGIKYRNREEIHLSDTIVSFDDAYGYLKYRLTDLGIVDSIADDTIGDVIEILFVSYYTSLEEKELMLLSTTVELLTMEAGIEDDKLAEDLVRYTYDYILRALAQLDVGNITKHVRIGRATYLVYG